MNDEQTCVAITHDFSCCSQELGSLDGKRGSLVAVTSVTISRKHKRDGMSVFFFSVVLACEKELLEDADSRS